MLDAPEDLKLYPPDHKETGFHILFDRVNFSYHAGRDTVRDISFALKKGETLGIIGATGCGKTTVLNLLLRLYDPDGGSIRIDGDDIRSIPFAELYARFGIVFQNDTLFADSLEENISFGRSWSTGRSRGCSVCPGALVHRRTGGGLDYRLTIRSANLSGGQKQRVLISRALAARPEILILDDASSAGLQTDARLRRALHTRFQGTTTLIVAQRVSSIRHADHIMMLENGRIIGYGAHEELLKTCAPYREISEAQMGGEAV
ncbi:MAG: ATP-binding cassette domain-containing protein [Hydrogeniiclostridium mannosilyticum]